MHRPRRASTALAALAVITLIAAASAAGASSDIDNDGNDDLVIGVPDEDVAQVSGAGAINILMGSDSGITARGDRSWTQADLSGTVEAIDRFGNAIAYGDFDRDGFDDIAIGAPAEDWNGQENAGVVHIVYGSSAVNRARRQTISQAGAMAGKNEAGDFFGAVLAVGDFDGDNYDDLAIGTPGEDVSGRIAAGGVGIIFGSRSGLDPDDSMFFSQKGTVPNKHEDFDAFGTALAVGDFNDDGRDDLAIGTPGEDVSGVENGGLVIVLYGRNSGIDKAGTAFTQSGIGLDDNAADDQFGYSLAAGDFDNDGVDDLAVGVRGEDEGGVVDAGAVMILRGNTNGMTASGAYRVLRNGGAMGTAAAGDEFGFTMTAGDVVGGGADDLIVGIPRDDINGVVDTGSVLVIPGSNTGTLATGNATVISQGPLASASDETDDRLGDSLRVGDFNGDGNDDLVIGSPSEDVSTRVDNGVIYVVYSDGTVLNPGSSRRLHQGSKGVKGAAEAGDRFGSGL